MRRSYPLLALAAWAAAAFAGAQLSQNFKEWPSTAAGLLLTKDERKAYEKLTTDAQAEAFLELFWAKRDPDLNTPVNEFKSDFDARVAAADRQFSTDRVKGSLSDRGRVLILLGRPSGIANQPAPAVAGRIENPGQEDRGATEVWTYRKDRLPADVKAEEVHFVFVENQVGTNQFVLDRGETRSARGLKVLAEAPERLLLHPKLTEAPKLGLLPGSKGASAADLEVLAAEPRPWPQGAGSLIAEGFMSASVPALWAYIELPTSTPAATRAIGRLVEAESGEQAGTFVVPVMAVGVGNVRAYEFALPVQPGVWKLDVALLDDSEPLAVTTLQGTMEPTDGDATVLSPLYWGVEVRQEAQAHLGDAFNVGGWHVLPRLSNQYNNKESLSYFSYVIRPDLDEQGKGQAKVGLLLFQGEKKISERPAEVVDLSMVSGDLWMYGSGLPLTVFRKSGDYRLEVTITNMDGTVSRTTKIPLAVTVDAPPAAPQG